jgi:hypothetical protein
MTDSQPLHKTQYLNYFFDNVNKNYATRENCYKYCILEACYSMFSGQRNREANVRLGLFVWAGRAIHSSASGRG